MHAATAAGWDSPTKRASEEEGVAGQARIGLAIGLAAYSVSVVASAVQFVTLADSFDVDAFGRSNQAFGATSGVGTVAGLLSNLASLATLAAGVLFLVWFHKAAVAARRIGLPARHEPLWAVLGFIIPIINLWFPYQVASDLFPKDAPERSVVGKWWACYLGASFSVFGVALSVFVARATVPLFVLVTLGLWVLAYGFARQLVDASVRVHRELAGGVLSAQGWGIPIEPA